ncbi:precorrin-6A reductase [Berryella wangjianweii]|uniref:Precorrin-6A reductase n=1 Tax=Berryella wangjianweii TaxID=2734634 RepID=A0A6M8IZW5_9ACTN|nr:precorrin-6A reductase [Berryella wangjianweii]QKF06874.1 precorrin-6A reductase [Berryella wangjianweii]
MRVLVFAGTTEGRQLAEGALRLPDVELTVCAATAYGGSLLPDHPRVRVSATRLDLPAMRALMASEGFDVVVDCTHPYADEASRNVAAAASAEGVSCWRVVREGEPEGPWLRCAGTDDAARALNEVEGNVLLTVGAQELGRYASLVDGFGDRVWARVLPVEESIAQARAAGVPVRRIVALQGPFSQELNEALMREHDIRALVTKASGSQGGFWQKVRAAERLGATCIVVGRPVREDGMSVDEALRGLRRMADGSGAAASDAVPGRSVATSGAARETARSNEGERR